MTARWQDYWDWEDKSTNELSAARDILEAAGKQLTDVRSRAEKEQPPDCEVFLNGEWVGIEVSKLVHQRTFEQTIKAKRERAAGRVPKRPEVFFSWPCDSLLAAIQARIDDKDVAHKGGPYKRYVLVLHSTEMFLYREHVKCLEGAKFRAGFITDVFFGLDYHPIDPPTNKGGDIPVFELHLIPR